MTIKHIMTFWDEETLGRNLLGTTRCGIGVFKNLDEAPTGPKLARNATTPHREHSDCARCKAIYDRSAMK